MHSKFPSSHSFVQNLWGVPSLAIIVRPPRECFLPSLLGWTAKWNRAPDLEKTNGSRVRMWCHPYQYSRLGLEPYLWKLEASHSWKREVDWSEGGEAAGAARLASTTSHTQPLPLQFSPTQLDSQNKSPTTHYKQNETATRTPILQLILSDREYYSRKFPILSKKKKTRIDLQLKFFSCLLQRQIACPNTERQQRRLDE